MGNNKISSLQGSPWHMEYLHMAEDDSRRDKRKCFYFHKENNYCSKLCTKCPGSSHCVKYKDTPSDNKKAVSTPEQTRVEASKLTPNRLVSQGVPVTQVAPVKSEIFFFENDSDDAILAQYRAATHSCPYCKRILKGNWVYNGKHEIIGLVRCKGKHTFITQAHLTQLDDDIFVR